jgi:ATP-dependent helicase/nuclease subunit A
VLGKEDVIRALVQAALDSKVVKWAATQRHWREVYVGAPWETGILEGYIDLLYEDGVGLVVVDYKTDAWRTETELDAKVSLYSVQFQAYADAVRTSVDREVVGAQLLFLRPGGAVARPISVAASLF